MVKQTNGNRLPKGKQTNKVTAKHKRSEAHLEKKEKKASAKENKASAMESDETPALQLTDEQKLAAKAERKKLNKDKILYKKNNYNCCGKNGPRQVNGTGFNLAK
jgi:hypothetical protein|mmetsp:Transcript_31872/g.70228  ORF Transcript_31872/g.70228 Transcript_31872/m.70228 type:complete len:105 (-) Transcript_31872:61-375(-)